MVKIHKAQELPELGAVGGPLPLRHHPDLLGVGPDAPLLQEMAKEFHGCSVEHALLGLNKQPVFEQSVEYLADMASMFLGSPGKHQDVIEVDSDKGVKDILQHVIDKGLENSRGVSQTERHDEVLKVSQVSVKPRLPFIPLSDTYQVVRIEQVELGEHRGVSQWLERGTEQREGVLIFDRDVIKFSIVNAWPQAAILLGHKDESSSHRGGGRSYDARGQGFRDIIAHRLLLWDRQIVQSPHKKRGPRKEIDHANVKTVRV